MASQSHHPIPFLTQKKEGEKKTFFFLNEFIYYYNYFPNLSEYSRPYPSISIFYNLYSNDSALKFNSTLNRYDEHVQVNKNIVEEILN